MTPQGLETLNDILDQFQNGNNTKEHTIELLQQLYKREPVNYRKVANPSDQGFVNKLDGSSISATIPSTN